MAAIFPTAIKTFTKKIDNSDPVVAADVNSVYDEVSAVESALGVNPATTGSWLGTFSTGTTWGSVGARIQNIEYGLNEAYTNFTDKRGGSTITPSTTTVVGVKVKARSAQTANLQEWRNSSDTVVTAVGPDGWVLTIDGGTA